jgi:hypothetical protein
MEAQRQAETTRRLALLIDMLHEEAGEGAPAPPEHAAAAWSEAAVRAFFVHGEAPAEAAAVQPGQPGGGRVQAPPGGGAKPEAATRAQNVLEAETYRAVVLAAGIAERPHGLFPPGDGVLRAIVTDATLRPFEKHLVGASCALERAEVSWPVGDDAARRGIDLRYFYKTGAPSGVGAKLVAAVRFGDAAAIGAGFWTSTHGGAVESAFASVAACCRLLTAQSDSLTSINSRVRRGDGGAGQVRPGAAGDDHHVLGGTEKTGAAAHLFACGVCHRERSLRRLANQHRRHLEGRAGHRACHLQGAAGGHGAPRACDWRMSARPACASRQVRRAAGARARPSGMSNKM